MAVKLSVGLQKKVGLPDYGSLGASCHVEFEIDGSLLSNDLAGFQQKVRGAFIACHQAVAESALEIRTLIKTKTPKAEVHCYPARSAKHFRRLFAVIRAYLDDLDTGRFVFRPGLGCGMCDYRETQCRAWQG